MNTVPIAGAVALVTGGQRGIGKAFADELLARGAARVYVTARTPVASDDPRIVPLPLEVTDDASVAALAASVSGVSIVVNNAGMGGDDQSLLKADVDGIKDLFDTNVFGPVRIAQALAPQLAANGGGALVDIHSVLSWIAGGGAYGATKAAIWSVTNSLRIELATQKTLVVGVHFGYVDTDMTRHLAVEKLPPSLIAKATLDGVEAGQTEVIIDDVSRHFKAALAGPVEGLSLPS